MPWLYDVPGQHRIRIEPVAACRGPGHFSLKPASELGDAAKYIFRVYGGVGRAVVAKADITNLDVLVAGGLDGQRAPTVSLLIRNGNIMNESSGVTKRLSSP